MEATKFIKPKTDWFGETVNGIYKGDRFNASDYNRIANNLTYLPERIYKLYNEKITVLNMTEKTYNDMLHASDINMLTHALAHLDNSRSVSNYGNYERYDDFSEGDFVMDYNYLNNIEHACEYIYNTYCAPYVWLHLNITNCEVDTSYNHNNKIKLNEPFTFKIVPKPGYSVQASDVQLTMGGVDVKNDYYNRVDKIINIPNVTGDVDIKVTAQRR